MERRGRRSVSRQEAVKRYVLTATVAFVLGIALACGVLLPRHASDTAKLDAQADDYRATIDAGRRELDEIGSALVRAEDANRELASRIRDLTRSSAASIDIAGQIRRGIDGDLDETRLAHDAIRKALGTIRSVPNASGETN